MVTRQGNATTLSFFPGGNENSSEGGDELNNSLPDVNGEMVDNWFTGDFRDTLESLYSDATDRDRELEEFSDKFHHYRFKNRIEVQFDTPDSETIDSSSVNVTYNDDLVYITLENEDNQLRDSTVRNELNITQNKRKAEPKPRYHNWTIGTVDGIDALHTASIWGAYDPYVSKMLNYAKDNSFDSLWDLLIASTPATSLLALVAAYVASTPAIWTWQEYTVLADGTELVRVWDVSEYPEHAGYLGDNKRDNVTINWAENQAFNGAFNKWSTAAQIPTTGPYQAAHWEYKLAFDGNNTPLPIGDESPLMAYGRTPDGQALTANDVDSMLADGYAVDPFDNKRTY
jgi:hypothetical protein